MIKYWIAAIPSKYQAKGYRWALKVLESPKGSSFFVYFFPEMKLPAERDDYFENERELNRWMLDWGIKPSDWEPYFGSELIDEWS